MRRTHALFRAGSLLLTILIGLASLPWAGPALAAGDMHWDPTQRPLTQTLQAPRTTTVTTEFTLVNDNTVASSFTISFIDLPGGWTARTTSGSSITLDAGASLKLGIRIDIPDNATAGRRTITIRATRSVPTPNVTADAFLDLTLVAQNPPPQATGVCPEPKDPGGDQGSAALILVDKEEGHGICSVGDEDWYKFGALAGKYYTIDIPVQDKGLDLALELYDANGKLLDANDDFPRSTDVLSDTRPRIQSFRAPASGYYYFRVRDTLGIGGSNLGYRVVVIGESYGKNPPPVASICNDRYEPDGLPEQAYTINPNETQKEHRLCPAGDADWIKFFALGGYTYYLYTNTRPYAGQDGTEPGADTLLFLFSRDGQTLIDFNNNVVGGSTLDSAIAFRPAADGVYYAQVKNVGDIGNMFLRYDISLKACPPEQPSCGPPEDIIPKAPPAAPPSSSAPPAPPAGQPASSPPQFLDSSAPPTDRDQFSVTPGALVATDIIQPTGAIDPAFQWLWQRSDMPVAGGRAARSWLWGPAARIARAEAYAQASGGVRQVLYFDKGRMELTRGPASPAVGSGLLVSEMVSGRVQVGDAEFDQRGPAAIGIVGDLDDARAPTYASLAGLRAPAGDRTGQLATETIDRAGQVGAFAGSRPETKNVRFVAATGHNIPAVFWDYFNTRGLIYEKGRYKSGQVFDWVATMGYPISEPYWTRVRVGGVDHDVLVQAYERRILTYMPDGQKGWQVQIGNVGRHYYRWRYGEDLPG